MFITLPVLLLLVLLFTPGAAEGCARLAVLLLGALLMLALLIGAALFCYSYFWEIFGTFMVLLIIVLSRMSCKPGFPPEKAMTAAECVEAYQKARGK